MDQPGGCVSSKGGVECPLGCFFAHFVRVIMLADARVTGHYAPPAFAGVAVMGHWFFIPYQ